MSTPWGPPLKFESGSLNKKKLEKNTESEPEIHKSDLAIEDITSLTYALILVCISCTQ